MDEKVEKPKKEIISSMEYFVYRDFETTHKFALADITASLGSNLNIAVNRLGDEVAFDCLQSVLSKKQEPFTFKLPNSWWDMFKMKYFPKGLKLPGSNRYLIKTPLVKVVEVDVQTLYPNIAALPQLDEPILAPHINKTYIKIHTGGSVILGEVMPKNNSVKVVFGSEFRTMYAKKKELESGGNKLARPFLLDWLQDKKAEFINDLGMAICDTYQVRVGRRVWDNVHTEYMIYEINHKTMLANDCFRSGQLVVVHDQNAHKDSINFIPQYTVNNG